MLILANIIQEAFSPLISLFEAVLVFIHDHAGISWGLAIVGLTVVVRAVMMPLTFSQFRSMRKMQLLAPDLKALKERYKDDKQRQNEEMMKLYRENKVNPFASCLPLALQLPVFISLFYMLRTDLKKHICGPALKAHGIVTTKAIEKATCSEVAPHSSGREIPIRAGHHREGDGVGAGGPDPGLPGFADRLDATDERQRRAEPALADARSPPGIRGDPLQVPGGPPDLLDHHQCVDDRAGLLRPPKHGPAPGTGGQRYVLWR